MTVEISITKKGIYVWHINQWERCIKKGKIYNRVDCRGEIYLLGCVYYTSVGVKEEIFTYLAATYSHTYKYRIIES